MKIGQSKFLNTSFILMAVIGFLLLGSLLGYIIDRTHGGLFSNFQFFKNFLMPDGIHYSIRSLEFSGQSKLEALELIKQQYQGTDIKVTDYYLNPSSAESALINSRLLYPLLSVPFVYLVGPNGMFVIPIIAYVILSVSPILVTKTIFEDQKILIPALFSIILIGSFYGKYNNLANTTDALSTLLLMIFSYVLYLNQHSQRMRLGLVATISLFCCLTRQNEIVILSIIVSYLVSRDILKNNKLYISLVTITPITIWVIISHKYFSNYTEIINANGPSFSSLNVIHKFQYLVTTCPKVFLIENIQLFIRDPFISLITIIALIFSFITFHEYLFSRMLIAVYASGILLTTINGSFGSGFRYMETVIYMSVFVLSNLTNRISVIK